MGLAVVVGEAAYAGATLGPRAIMNAVSNASIFLGAADALSSLNICSSILRLAVKGRCGDDRLPTGEEQH